MKKEYSCIASRHFCNTAGIEIVEIIHDIEDYVKYRTWCAGKGYGKVTKSKIRCDEDGSAYFKFGVSREYLSEYMRAV